MMQDFPRLCTPEDPVGFSQVDRLMSFTCVKNPPDCALSAEADIYACNARLLELAGKDVDIQPAEDVTFLGITAQVGARIVLQPSFGISLEQLKERVKGKVIISARSALVLEGDVVLNG